MADTLTTTTTVSTIPSGTVIATDDAGAGGHVQIVKLALSADGSATAITADANGLEVQGAGVAGTPAGGVVSIQGVASGTVVPISAASLPLPTSASTLAEQQAQTTHLATIAGDTTAIETAVQLIDDTVKVLGTDTYTEATSKGLVVGAVRRDADTTLADTTNEFTPLQVDALGRLKVEAFSGETLPVSAASLPLPTGAATEAKQDTIITHVDGVEALLTTIDADTGTLAGAVSGTEVQVDVVAALPAGSNTIGGAIPRPTTSGGLDIFRSLDIDETEEEVKATAGQLYGYYFSNAATSMRFLKFYNATAASVTVGTTTPVLTLGLPASSAGHVEFAHGIAFGTAITVAATTAVADADTGAPSANDVVINVFYK